MVHGATWLQKPGAGGLGVFLQPMRCSLLRFVEGKQCQDIGARNMIIEWKVRVGVLVILKGVVSFGRRYRWAKVGDLEDSG